MTINILNSKKDNVANSLEVMPMFQVLLLALCVGSSYMFASESIQMKTKVPELKNAFHMLLDDQLVEFKNIIMSQYTPSTDPQASNVPAQKIQELESIRQILKTDDFNNAFSLLMNTQASHEATNNPHFRDAYILVESVNQQIAEFAERFLNLRSEQVRKAAVRLIATALSSYRMSFSLQDHYGRTILHRAALALKTAMPLFFNENLVDATLKDIEGYTALHYVVEGDLVECIPLLKTTLEIPCADSSTALIIAAAGGKTKSLIALLEQGAHINAQNNDGETALHAAIKKGHIDCVRELIRRGAKLQIRNNNGNMPLHCAAYCDDDSIFKAVLEAHNTAGIHLDEKNNDKDTPLMYAAYYGQASHVELLLKAGANKNCACNNGSTPLIAAAFEGNIECLKILLHARAHLDKKNLEGYSALLTAAEKEDSSCVNALIEAGADIAIKDSVDDTALHKAAMGGHLQNVRLLLKKGAPKNARNAVGRTPLLCAAMEGHLLVIEELLSHDVDVTITSVDGYTALHEAAYFGHADCVRRLLKTRIDKNAVDKDKKSALLKAVERNHPECVKALVEANVNLELKVTKEGYTALHEAAFEGFEECLEILLSAGAHVNTPDKNNLTALHKAVSRGHVRCARALLKKKASTNLTGKNQPILLATAAAMGNVELIALLLEHNADPNLQSAGENSDRESPMHSALVKDRAECLELLIRGGGDIEIECAPKTTLLMMAAYYGSLKSLKVLLAHGADTDKRNGNNMTAYDAAVKQGHTACAEAIRLHKKSFPKVGTCSCACSSPEVHNETADTQALMAACAQGDSTGVSNLLASRKINSNGILAGGNTVLHMASLLGKDAIVKLLLEYKPLNPQHAADVNLTNSKGAAALSLALLKKHYLIAHMLLAALCQKFPELKKTPLHFAAEIGNLEFISFLLKNGEAVNGCSAEGYTPLHCAVATDNAQELVIRALIQGGADIFAKAANGEMALDIALRKGNKEIVALFDEARTNASSNKEICSVCGAHRNIFCGFCLKVRYCSESCKQKDWKRYHQKRCPGNNKSIIEEID